MGAVVNYEEIADPLLEKAGAKIVNRSALDECGVGQQTVETVVDVEFPNEMAIKSVFESPERLEAMKYRDAAFSTYTKDVVN